MAGWRERERDLAAVEELLQRRGGVLLIEGRAGIGKTSLVEVACSRAEELGHEVVRARGSELESGFAFGVVRQLFERRLASAGEGERAALLAGPAAVRPLLAGEVSVQPADGSSFAVLHGLYWLVVNLAAGRPLLIAVDDAHWADEPSLRWLAYLAPRLEGLAGAALVGKSQLLGAVPEEVELFSTFGGNPVACAAALAVLDVIEDEGLVANAAKVGSYLRQGLLTLAERRPLIGDVIDVRVVGGAGVRPVSSSPSCHSLLAAASSRAAGDGSRCWLLT
ncbi:MAG: aminotransferase class III-fold pyridoxal phosphate-dependent enzyme [Streptosporangiaceae bacterium]